MKPKKSAKKKAPILDNDGETTMTPRKSPPIKKKRGPKPGKASKKKKKYVRKRKEEEFRIFFPPPRLNPQLKTPFKLHNTTCTHHDWITDNLNLPKYASYQTGWRVSYITMKSIILLDSKRATFLKLFNLYKKRGIKKAIFGKDRRGVAKIDLMPKKWSFSKKLPDIDGLEEENAEIEKLPIKLDEIKTEPPRRPTRPSILRKFHKKPAIWTISHEKSRRKPRKRRYMRCPRIPGRRMIEFRRNRNEKRRKTMRNWEKVFECPLRIRLLRSQMIRKRECRVETSCLLKWIQKEKMEEWKTEEHEKKKRRIEEEEDVAWDKYVESQTDEWNLENVIPGELSLEVDQEFKHSNRNWTVVEKKGCDEQGFQYLLVLTEELNGVQRIRYDRSAIDYKFRKMRNEKGGTDEYITSLPVYHPKPPKTRYPAFPGENFEKERELERRRVEDEDKVRRDAELAKEDKRMFKKVVKRETMIKRYRDRIRREIWIRRRRALQNPMKTPKIEEEIDPLQPSTSSGIIPLKGILKTSSRHQNLIEEEDVEKPHINGISQNSQEKIEKIDEKPPKIDEILEKNRRIPLKNGRRLRRKKVKIEEEEAELDGLIKEEIKMEIGVNNTMNDCNNQVISLTNCHLMPSTSSSSQSMELKTELTETTTNAENTDDISENRESTNRLKQVTFKLSNQQKLSKIWRPMGWQIKEMLRTIGVGRGYKVRKNKIRSKRSRRNERIRLNNIFHGIRHNFKSPPTRIDEFEKGVDIREQPIPFVEEFILDDHSIIAFSSHQDLKTYEQAVSLRTEEMIDEFWRVQCVKNIEKAEDEKRRKDELKSQIEKLDVEMRIQNDNLTERIDRENVESFETAGRHVEKIINDTGDCPFDTLDEYFSIAAEFQRHEELRSEEEIEENEADIFGRELEGLISLVKQEYSIVDLMMRILRNRHLLTMRLVVSGINQSPIDRQLLLKKIRKLLIELKKKRESIQEMEKLKNERREKRRESLKQLEKRVLRKAQKLVMKRRNKNNLKMTTKNGLKTKKKRRKWTIHVECQEKSMKETKKMSKKRRKRRKLLKQPRDLRWSFKQFGWYNGVGRRNFQLHRNSIRKALAWGFKWEEIFGETEFERILREYMEYEEMDIKNQVSIDRKIELITKIKTITLNDVRMRATAMQNQQVAQAVELMSQDASNEYKHE
ncbi:hypothetical protein CRE_05846 [Caenorhabditis remanei]|uniref:Uncharacterized protein n=1 Tax=Caenorhabditis remanei TaxID=31234 RepID=E3MNP0_CAERE|nr:hypothetical protein CRE_05846 [Caenorhabditis remanei]